MRFLIYTLAIFCLSNVFAQQKPFAYWVRHSCGFDNGTTKYNGNLFGDAVCTDSTGNVYNAGYLTGSYYTLDTAIQFINNKSAFINKFDKNGIRIWTKFIASSQLNTIVRIAKIKTDFLGNFYICGNVGMNPDSIFLSPNWYKVNNGFIAKFNANGENIWCKTVEGISQNEANIDFVDFCITSSQIYICGNMNFGKAKFGNYVLNCKKTSNAVISRLSSYNGNIEKCFILDSNSTNSVNAMVVSEQQNIYIVGEQNNNSTSPFTVNDLVAPFIENATNSYVLKLNFNMKPAFLKYGYTYLRPNTTIGQSLKSLSKVQIDKAQNIYVSGNGNGDSTRFENLSFIHKQSNSANYYQDIYILKYNTYGDIMWLKHGGSDENDFITDIITDEDGNTILSVGSGQQALSGLIFGNDTIKQNHGGLIKINSNGNLIYSKNLQENRVPNALSFGKDSSLYITGTGLALNSLYDTIQIGYCENKNGAPSDYNMYISKFKNPKVNTVNIESKVFKYSFQMYPNPSIGMIKLQTNFVEPIYIEIYDAKGLLLINEPYNTISKNIDLTQLSSGIYFAKIFTTNHQILNHQKILLLNRN